MAGQNDTDLVNGLIKVLGLTYQTSVPIATRVRQELKNILLPPLDMRTFLLVLKGETKPDSVQSKQTNMILNQLYNTVVKSFSDMNLPITPDNRDWQDCVLGFIAFAAENFFQEFDFRINNQKSGGVVVAGTPFDLSFFYSISEQVQGQCKVVFKVGDQKVENEVILGPTGLSVSNKFKPYDIDSYISREKERVHQEQEQAHFSDSPIDVYYLSATSLLDCTHTFPVFDRSNLVKDPPGSKYFVSHRWLSKTHPDPEGKHLALLKQHALKHPDAFYWIDFSCLPQSRNLLDEELFNRTLPKIASIQAKSSTIVIMENDYAGRLWCYIEHFTGVLFSQCNLTTVGTNPCTIEYLGAHMDQQGIINEVQQLKEPDWGKFKVTKSSDIPGIKYNYRWTANLVRFQLYDRYSELRNSLPGHEAYSGLHYFQSAFGISYAQTLNKIRSLFIEFGGDIQNFYTDNSLLWLAERFSYSVFPDDYKMNELKFSRYLLFSEKMVGWIAALLGIIKIANQENDKIVNLRDLYSKIILMSLFE